MSYLFLLSYLSYANILRLGRLGRLDRCIYTKKVLASEPALKGAGEACRKGEIKNE